MAVVVRLGDCFDVLATLPDESVHAVVCDPPYGINFMGKAWDGKAIAEDAEKFAARADYTGVMRPTGSVYGPGKSGMIQRTQSAYGGRAGEAGSYDFTLRGNRAFQQWVERWGTECLRVLKPGGHLLSFGGTRTYHRLAAGLEDAGFEIRDCLCWMFGSGFPKSAQPLSGILSLPRSTTKARYRRWHHDVRTTATGTALKPAFEPIVLARKPLVSTVAATVLAHGTGALNVDACRIGMGGGGGREGEASAERRYAENGATSFAASPGPRGGAAEGRWPANVVLDEQAAAILDAQTGTLTSGSEPDAGFVRHPGDDPTGIYGGGKGLWIAEGDAGSLYGDSGGASRFFYCAKVSRAERNAGCDSFDPRMMRWSSGDQSPGTFQSEGTDKTARNHHPTVKPVALMRWLIRLVTPPGGTVLDPFTGSGSTGIAAALEGFDFIGIEREADYHRIAEARIAWWTEHGERALDIAKVAEREKPPEEQQSIYSELA